MHAANKTTGSFILACISLSFLSLIAAPSDVFAKASPAAGSTQMIGKVEKAFGEVRVKNKTMGKRFAVKGAEMYIGDLIKTDADSRLVIRFQDDSRIHVGPNSKFMITEHLLRKKSGVGTAILDLIYGQVRLWTAAKGPDLSYQIRTKNATTGVRGTELEVVYWRQTKFTMVAVVSGEVEMQDRYREDAKPQAIAKGQCGWAIKKKGVSEAFPMEKAPEFFRFIGNGDKAPPEPKTPPPGDVDEDDFY